MENMKDEKTLMEIVAKSTNEVSEDGHPVIELGFRSTVENPFEELNLMESIHVGAFHDILQKFEPNQRLDIVYQYIEHVRRTILGLIKNEEDMVIESVSNKTIDSMDKGEIPAISLSASETLQKAVKKN
jgi:hypothetical protein